MSLIYLNVPRTPTRTIEFPFPFLKKRRGTQTKLPSQRNTININLRSSEKKKIYQIFICAFRIGLNFHHINYKVKDISLQLHFRQLRSMLFFCFICCLFHSRLFECRFLFSEKHTALFLFFFKLLFFCYFRINSRLTYDEKGLEHRR